MTLSLKSSLRSHPLLYMVFLKHSRELVEMQTVVLTLVNDGFSVIRSQPQADSSTSWRMAELSQKPGQV